MKSIPKKERHGITKDSLKEENKYCLELKLESNWCQVKLEL